MAITPVLDYIETWGFRLDDPCDFPNSPISHHEKFTKPNIAQPLKNGDFGRFLAIIPVWDYIKKDLGVLRE